MKKRSKIKTYIQKIISVLMISTCGYVGYELGDRVYLLMGKPMSDFSEILSNMLGMFINVVCALILAGIAMIFVMKYENIQNKEDKKA